MKNATTVGAGSIGASPAKKVASYRLAGMASMAGTTIEWYDFFLYGTAAALIFGKIFFPALDPISGVLAAFATYAVGFLGRPLGGIIFGHFGDRIGRKSMLLLTLMMMGIPTIVIGLIPTYDQIGYWAAVILVLMRFLQGMAVGGEWGGAVLMAVEHAPEGKKGFMAACRKPVWVPAWCSRRWLWAWSPNYQRQTCCLGDGACRLSPASCCWASVG